MPARSYPPSSRSLSRLRFFVRGCLLLLLFALGGTQPALAVNGWLETAADAVEASGSGPFAYSSADDSVTSPRRGDVFAFDETVPPAFWGNHAQALAGPLAWRSTPFRLKAPWLVVPVIGPRHLTLALVTIDNGPRLSMSPTAAWAINASDATPDLQVFDVGIIEGRLARLEVTADDAAEAAWSGIAQPLAAQDLAAAQSIAEQAQARYRNDFTYFKRVAAITLSLLGFSLLAATCAPRFRLTPGTAFGLTIAATIVAWATTGLAQWIGWTAVAHGLAGTLWWGGLIAGGIGLMIGLGSALRRRKWTAVLLGGLYFAGVLSAHLGTVPDLPILGESGLNNPLRARMVASPPDNIIPFCTAIYMFHGKDGREDRAVYFGQEWAVTSRGPLLPLVITGLFVACDHHPHDPVYPADRRWPADAEGMYIARAAAITLNGLLLPAVFALAASFSAARPGRAWLAAALLALSPFFNENMTFVWPKLIAATGVVVALLLVRREAPRTWPVVIVLAYLAHPLALLFCPALAIYEWARSPDRTLSSFALTAIRRALPVIGLLLPWWIHKQWVGHPDVMLGYVLGDGHGFTRAETIGTWSAARLANAAHTFIPGYWWFTGQPFYWFDDWISGVARWAVFDGRSLWGQLGTVAGLVVGATLLRRATQLREEWIAFILPTAATLLVFWGFSRDGLGRQCLEPLTATILAIGVAQLSLNRGWTTCLLLAGAIELTILRVGSISWDTIVRPTFLWRSDLIYLGAAAVVWILLPLAWATATRGNRSAQADAAHTATATPPA